MRHGNIDHMGLGVFNLFYKLMMIVVTMAEDRYNEKDQRVP